MAPARAYFPIVGLGLGGILAGIDFAAGPVLPSLAVGALLVASLLVLTRAIHTEGFLDACDGLFGGYIRARRLEILRDTHVGAFAVVGGTSLLLLKLTLLAGVPDGMRSSFLLLFPCLSRIGMLSTMSTFPYSRTQGIGTAFQDGSNWRQVAVGLVTSAAAGGLLLGLAGLFLLVGAAAISLLIGWWMTGMLGGMTGDTYGAVNEVAEVTVLLAGIMLFGFAPDLFRAPCW